MDKRQYVRSEKDKLLATQRQKARGEIVGPNINIGVDPFYQAGTSVVSLISFLFNLGLGKSYYVTSNGPAITQYVKRNLPAITQYVKRNLKR